MVLLFGYMDFLIVYKWLQNWGYYSTVAPSIITTMINLPLKLGKTVNNNLFRMIAVEECQCGDNMALLLKTLSRNGF
jgi:V-type ATPase 116kDa subunit family